MMLQLMRLAEQWAKARQELVAAQLAARAAATLRGASVSVEEARVVVSGKGLVKRWLIDPQLRFLNGDHG